MVARPWALVTALLLIGCGAGERAALKQRPLTKDEQIRRIQSSGMPEDAKARAIASFQEGR